MNENDFEAWLVQKHSNRNTVGTYLRDAKRVERHNEDFADRESPDRTARPSGRVMTVWAISASRRRPGDHVTAGDVGKMHTDRSDAEQDGADLPGPVPDLVRLERRSERVWVVAWSLSTAANGKLRRPPPQPEPPPPGPFNAPRLVDA